MIQAVGRGTREPRSYPQPSKHLASPVVSETKKGQRPCVKVAIYPSITSAEVSRIVYVDEHFNDPAGKVLR